MDDADCRLANQQRSLAEDSSVLEKRPENGAGKNTGLSITAAFLPMRWAAISRALLRFLPLPRSSAAGS